MKPCILPWINFGTNTFGRPRVCGYSDIESQLKSIMKWPPSENFITEYTLENSSIEKEWNNTYFTEIRKSFLNNEWPENCSRCKHVEEQGGVSKRMRENHMWYDKYKHLIKENVDYENIENFDLRFVDLHWSNICNLRCVMCNPEQSSLIAKDQKVFVTPVNAKSIKKIISMIKEHQDKIKEIYMSGGEPFYIPYNVKLLQELTNKDIPIRINTNMNWKTNNKFFELLKNFNNVQLTMSADALGKKFNYIRNGADWEIFEYNLDYIKNETNFDIRINLIFSIINANSICDTIDYFYNKKKINDITINLLYNPESLDARNYPKNKKEYIVNAIERLILTISSKDVNLINNLKNCLMQIQLPNQRDYKESLDKLTEKNMLPWQEVFKDLV